MGDGKAISPTIADLLFAGGQPDSSDAVIGVDGKAATYGELRGLVREVVGDLGGYGCRNGERIALSLPNGPLLATAIVAVSASYPCAPLNPGLRAGELRRLLKKLNVKAVVVQEGVHAEAREVAGDMGVPLIEARACGSAGIFRLEGKKDRSGQPAYAGTGDDAFLLHTSGTTATPKLVPLTHSNICHTAYYIGRAMGLGPKDRCLNVMPLFHGLGLVSLLSTLLNGGSIICAPGFEPGEFFGWLERLGPTWYTAVPPVHQTILDLAPSHRGAVSKSRLRFIRSAASAMSPKLMLGLEECFGVPVLEAYGMTEAFIIGSNPPPPGKRKPGSVGVASGPQVAIMDGAGAFVGSGVVGEIVVRGPNVMRGYEDDPVENAHTFVNGWMRTGDIGHIDADGYIFLEGRVKELINRGGEKVTPNEVDDTLSGHPSVKEAAVFSVPHPSLGEDVAAAVVLKSGSSASEDELRSYVLERLAPYKVPARFYFVDSIPKGPSGKILRREIPKCIGISTKNAHAVTQRIDASCRGGADHLCVHEIFEKVVAEDPSRAAFSNGGKDVSYGELNSKANRLARLLRSEGVEPGQSVGVCMERSLELVISYMAILKAGAAYLPLYPSELASRLASQVDGAGVRLAITKRVYDSLIPQGVKRIYIYTALEDAAPFDGSDVRMATSPESPAHMLCVPGPDGVQRAVLVPHRAVIGMAVGADYATAGREDAVAFQSSPNTNLASWEIWIALLNGARLVMFTLGDILSPRRFAKKVKYEGVTILGLNTPFFNLFANEAEGAFASLKTVVFTGEEADSRSVRRVFEGGPPRRLVNAYGCTEATPIVIWHRIMASPSPEDQIPIGGPASHARAYILDDRLREVPVGSAGELYIGGDAVALGYANDPEATDERFLADPFCPGGRMYRTGDFAKKTVAGSIHYLGRADKQVKIHGFRVELGEIERELMKHPAVGGCEVSYTYFAGSSEKILVARVKPKGAAVLNKDELRSHLDLAFRDYMRPSHFILEEGGAGLIGGAHDGAASPSQKGGGEVMPSVLGIERRLIEIWEGEMGIRGIKPSDNFFHIGGYSLMAVRIFSRIEASFGVRLSLSKIYRKPTVEALAEELRKAQPRAFRSLVPLREGGKRRKLFLVHPVGGELVNYDELVEALGGDQPVWGLRAAGIDGEAPLPGSIEEMAMGYVAEVKALQPQGPYHLAGWCAGGAVAYEMARQLRGKGDAVGLVGILDFEAPEAGSKYDRRYARGTLFRETLYLGADLLKYGKRRQLAKSLDLLSRSIHLVKLSLMAAGAVSPDEVTLHGEFAPLPDRWKAVILNTQSALHQYMPGDFDGVVTVFKKENLPLVSSPDPTDGWGEHAKGGIAVIPISGRMHYSMVKAPHVRTTAKGILERMDWHERRLGTKKA